MLDANGTDRHRQPLQRRAAAQRQLVAGGACRRPPADRLSRLPRGSGGGRRLRRRRDLHPRVGRRRRDLERRAPAARRRPRRRERDEPVAGVARRRAAAGVHAQPHPHRFLAGAAPLGGRRAVPRRARLHLAALWRAPVHHVRLLPPAAGRPPAGHDAELGADLGAGREAVGGQLRQRRRRTYLDPAGRPHRSADARGDGAGGGADAGRRAGLLAAYAARPRLHHPFTGLRPELGSAPAQRSHHPGVLHLPDAPARHGAAGAVLERRRVRPRSPPLRLPDTAVGRCIGRPRAHVPARHGHRV